MCLQLTSETDYYHQVEKMEVSFGNLSTIDDLSVIRNNLMNERIDRQEKSILTQYALFNPHSLTVIIYFITQVLRPYAYIDSYII